ncbi:MAG: hypothetical protein ABIR67_04115 [Gaiellaceae bacterium]
MTGETRSRTDVRRYLLWLGALAVVRAAIPLAAIVSGGLLPGFPSYSYEGPRGDANGYISDARALVSAGSSYGLFLPALLAALVAGLLGARWTWRRYPGDRHWVIAAVGGLASCLLAAVILRLEGQAGSGAVGWPLILSLPLVPFRVLGWIDNEVAVGVGIVLAIVANTVTIFATAFIGYRASGSRQIGIAAAALFAVWPFLIWMLLGEQTWENGAWEVETGLSLYSEPLSTACVAAGIALGLVRGRPPWAVVAAGIACGYAAAVRPTNIVFAVAAALLFASDRDWRSAGRFVVGGVAVLPIVLAFLPKKRGYDLELVRDQTGMPLWSNDYVVSSFTDSSVWEPLLLALLLPLVAIGAVALRSRGVALMLLGGALANAAIYSFFRATFEHPRYLHAGLPALFVLWSAGAAWLADHAHRTSRPAQVRSS